MGDQVYFPETVFIWSSLWSKETPIDQSVLQVLLACLRRNDSQTLKLTSCKMPGTQPVIKSTSLKNYLSFDNDVIIAMLITSCNNMKDSKYCVFS